MNNDKSPNLKELFSDIEPIPQDDGPNPVCSISYTSEFVEAMNYLRAILRLDERSQRALDLTTICLRLNPANYTTWHFRRRCLSEISSRLSTSDKNSSLKYDDDLVKSDLTLASDLGGGNPKNYQIWYHRRALLESFFLQDKSLVSTEVLKEIISKSIEELKYVSAVFEIDAKNYHAWSHRQWILRTVNDETLWNDEMKYVHQLISNDHRNNSAWNQRWFAFHRGLNNNIDPSLSLADAMVEAEYALISATADPYNESSWRYLIGVLSEQHRSMNDETKNEITSLLKSYQERLENLLMSLAVTEGDVEVKGCYQLTSAQIDILEMIFGKDSLVKAAAMARELATGHDTIRAKYWFVREKELLENAATLSDN